MDIVDSQVHVFFTLDLEETVAAMNAIGIQSVIIDEYWGTGPSGELLPAASLRSGGQRPLSPLAQAAVLKHPDRFGILQRVERTDPALASWVSVLADFPGCKAVRLITNDRTELQALANGDYDDIMRLAQRHDFAVNFFGQGAAAALDGVLSRFPDVRCVLDHCGAPASQADWDAILSAGRSHPNLWLKWSHAHWWFEAGPYPYAGLQAQLIRALDAFSRERVMWASDFTHERLGRSWGELLFYLRDSQLLSEIDKGWLLGRAARIAYRWPAPAEAFSPPHLARLGPLPYQEVIPAPAAQQIEN
ncbi:amidohydrolase family protein [Bradyrhizobium zhanjiangense]|uniref:amidohydrolase family protein n=1 Tax=Bradyrhizobium zhanjiangense TaxID=1325107 RepID=UPI0010093C23|nr:amidohydrolase family protein [Bradyrhizobium zhanjiangense]